MKQFSVAQRVSVSAFIAFAGLTLGCGEPPGSVTGAVPAMERTESSTPSSAIDISSSAGVMQLDPNTMILSDGEGRRVQLEGETQTVVLNTVDIMTVTDANVQTFAAEPFPASPSECSPSLGNCAESRLDAPPRLPGKRPRLDDAFQGRLKLKVDRDRRRPARGRVPRVSEAPGPGGTGSGLFRLASWTVESPCYDIAVAIYGVTQHYDALKSAWVYDVRARMQSAATGTAQSGAPPTLSGAISGLSVAMAVWYQDFMTTKLALDQLAYRYSANSCWTRKWQDRSAYVRDGFSPSGSGRQGFFMKTCSPVYIEIEVDGQIWWEGWAEECEYTFHPYGEMRADPTAGSPGSTHHERSSQVTLHRTLTTV